MSAAERSRAQDDAEIRRVVLTYCRAVDRCDAELLRSVYHDDAVDEHGSGFSGSADDFVAWVMGVLRQRFSMTMHTVPNILVEIDGDVAAVESYLVAYHIAAHAVRDAIDDVVADEVATDGRGPVLRILGGRYVDRFEWRPDVGWRIAHRVVVAEWHAEHHDALLPLPAGMTQGVRDRTDVIYSGAVRAGAAS